MLLAVRLFGGLLDKIAVLVQFRKDVLRNVRLLLSRSPTEDIEFDLEPFVNFGVDLVVLRAQLFRRNFLF